MLTALLSDIHSNLEALEACLRHAREAGAQRHAFLGDLVGYGADPAAVIATVRRHQEQGAVVVLGNHDQAVGQAPSGARGSGMNDVARAAIDWTRAELDGQDREWLASLPLVERRDGACYVHASADAPGHWPYVEDGEGAMRSVAAAGATWTFSGHVHEQALYFETAGGRMGRFVPRHATPVPVGRHRRWLAVVGSVGQPRDRNPAAAYALFDDQRDTLTFLRVPYDQPAASAKIIAAGLPRELAWRLEEGV